MKMMYILFYIFIVYIMTSSTIKKRYNKYKKIKINKRTLSVEIANTKLKRTRGLMYRRKIKNDNGMLFIFPRKSIKHFWMKNTYVPLSVAFIDNKKIISQIDHLYPLDLNGVYSKEKVKYVLEVPMGWFNKNNVKIGDKVLF